MEFVRRPCFTTITLRLYDLNLDALAASSINPGGISTPLNMRKSQEEESLRLAMQLQAQEEQYAMQQQQLSLAQQQSAVSQRAAQQQVRRKRVVVPLPPNASPGQVLRVQVPGHGLMSVQVPQGATPGQALEFYVAPPQQMEVKKVRVVLPQNAVPGQNITVKVPVQARTAHVKPPIYWAT